jgi:hypothetical protein
MEKVKKVFLGFKKMLQQDLEKVSKFFNNSIRIDDIN